MMPRVPLHFVKYHGLGNDFVLVEPSEGDRALPDAAAARRVCDRHRGIGADGLVSILPPRTPGATATMHIYNSDGSVAAMCGNAIRCVARHLAETRGAPASMVIDTDSGPKTCTVHRGPGGEVESVSVEMGPASLQGEERFTVAGEPLVATRVSMGNPHAVLLEGAPTVARARAVGPALEAAVQGGVNVGFARPGPDGIDLVVWERGAGLTDACGTGACAAAVTAVSKRLAPAGRPIPVRLPGGLLQITVAPDLVGVVMRGPAERVFAGEADL